MASQETYECARNADAVALNLKRLLNNKVLNVRTILEYILNQTCAHARAERNWNNIPGARFIQNFSQSVSTTTTTNIAVDFE